MVKIELNGEVQIVKERYLQRFLDSGWAIVSDTNPKKPSKNKITKVTAEVEQAVETESVQEELPLTNPPINQQGE